METIKGHYRDEGGLLERGSLLVAREGSGWVAPEYWGDNQILAKTFKVIEGYFEIEITCNSATFYFIPDKGECERIGIPVEGI